MPVLCQCRRRETRLYTLLGTFLTPESSSQSGGMNLNLADVGVGIWSLIWVAVAGVIAYRGRGDRLAAAGGIIAIAAFLAALEDPSLVMWLASVTPSVDPGGAAALVQPHTRGHMYGAGVFALAALMLSVWIARTALRRGERWAWQALLAVLILGGGVDLVEVAFIYPHGFPLSFAPVGAARGFGWEQIAAWIGIWAFALWYCRTAATLGLHAGNRSGARL